MSAAYLGASREAVTGEAVGSIAAQKAIEGLQRDELTPAHAWLAFCTLAASGGWKSAACRAFVAELVKRAGAR